MTPPRSIIGSISDSKLLRVPARRRALLAVMIFICLLLTAFPERHRAAVTMTPTDPSSLGLSGALGQLGALNSAFGNQAAVEVSMKVARSVYVRENVIRRLNLIKRKGFSGEIEASRWLERNVSIRTMRGGILQIEIFGSDPALGREIVAAYQDATQSRLGEVARRQTAYKRGVLEKLFDEAGQRLDEAQNAYDTFRLQTRYSDPSFAMEAIGGRIPVLEAAIKAKQVELNAARQFATDDNMTVRQIMAQIDALQRQLAQFQALTPKEDNSIGRVVRQSTRAMRLERELEVAQALYDSYKRYLEGTAVEDLTATATVRVLEPAFIDTARQWNLPPLALGILLFLIGLAVEFYNLRPPVGSRRSQS
jgi:tyrosine-protein kinase Etk/Wzc